MRFTQDFSSLTLTRWQKHHVSTSESQIYQFYQLKMMLKNWCMTLFQADSITITYCIPTSWKNTHRGFSSNKTLLIWTKRRENVGPVSAALLWLPGTFTLILYELFIQDFIRASSYTEHLMCSSQATVFTSWSAACLSEIFRKHSIQFRVSEKKDHAVFCK